MQTTDAATNAISAATVPPTRAATSAAHNAAAARGPRKNSPGVEISPIANAVAAIVQKAQSGTPKINESLPSRAGSLESSSPAEQVRARARSRRVRLRCPGTCRADHRVRATPDRQLGRRGTVYREPRLDRVDHLNDRAGLPLRANTDLVAGPVEVDRRAVEQGCETPQQSMNSRGVFDRDVNLHHRILPGSSVVADQTLGRPGTAPTCFAEVDPWRRACYTPLDDSERRSLRRYDRKRSTEMPLVKRARTSAGSGGPGKSLPAEARATAAGGCRRPPARSPPACGRCAANARGASRTPGQRQWSGWPSGSPSPARSSPSARMRLAGCGTRRIAAG